MNDTSMVPRKIKQGLPGPSARKPMLQVFSCLLQAILGQFHQVNVLLAVCLVFLTNVVLRRFNCRKHAEQKLRLHNP